MGPPCLMRTSWPSCRRSCLILSACRCPWGLMISRSPSFYEIIWMPRQHEFGSGAERRPTFPRQSFTSLFLQCLPKLLLDRATSPRASVVTAGGLKTLTYSGSRRPARTRSLLSLAKVGGRPRVVVGDFRRLGKVPAEAYGAMSQEGEHCRREERRT